MTFAAIARMIGIKGFIAIGLALALAAMWHRAGVWEDRAEEQAQAAANERAAHAVTKASLANLEQRLAAFIADGAKRTKAAQRALERQESHSAALASQIARIRAEKPSAEALARCETPASVRQAEGL